jgi:hypothetical protein
MGAPVDAAMRYGRTRNGKSVLSISYTGKEVATHIAHPNFPDRAYCSLRIVLDPDTITSDAPGALCTWCRNKADHSAKRGA